MVDNEKLKVIPLFHSTIPFHCSIPSIPDSQLLQQIVQQLEFRL